MIEKQIKQLGKEAEGPSDLATCMKIEEVSLAPHLGFILPGKEGEWLQSPLIPRLPRSLSPPKPIPKFIEVRPSYNS